MNCANGLLPAALISLLAACAPTGGTEFRRQADAERATLVAECRETFRNEPDPRLLISCEGGALRAHWWKIGAPRPDLIDLLVKEREVWADQLAAGRMTKAEFDLLDARRKTQIVNQIAAEWRGAAPRDVNVWLHAPRAQAPAAAPAPRQRYCHTTQISADMRHVMCR
jgi:hypothetical protein